MYISLTKITIVLCWLSLFSFWVIKIFGGNWFEIMVENENFVQFSDLVQSSWLKYLGSFISTGISYYFILSAVFFKPFLKGFRFVTYLIIFISTWAVCNFINLEVLRVIYGYVLIILASFVINQGKLKFNGIVFILLDFVFCTISMLTRNINLSVIQDYLIMMILSIDMYIMYFLYYLYSILIKLKGDKKWHFGQV